MIVEPHTHAVLPSMMDRGFGKIVTVASDAGRVGSTGEVVYSGAKGAVIAFTKGLPARWPGTASMSTAWLPA